MDKVVERTPSSTAGRGRTDGPERPGAPRSADVEASTTLIDVVQHWSVVQPDDRALTFVVNGSEEIETLTYGDLERRARSIASHLRSVCGPGDRVVLLYPPELE